MGKGSKDHTSNVGRFKNNYDKVRWKKIETRIIPNKKKNMIHKDECDLCDSIWLCDGECLYE